MDVSGAGGRQVTIVGIRAALTAVASLTFGLSAAVQPARADRPPGVAQLAERRVTNAMTLHPGAAPRCAQRVYDRMFFGLGTADGNVPEEAWSRFLADVVTPRLPDGLTVIEAHGQWRAPGAQAITVERSRVVEIAHDGTPEIDRVIDDVIAIYRRRHDQRAVMRTRARVDVCF